ncbi:mitochondrial nicotinamide adenine dinucleotide transporter SLC25A51 [Drosophila albomicans]|uniref:Mitochondrial nicotinamide adenine dinucleotide transporter SLC25A51 n=1 Tax=Drosophila albomicans TaxID=7291 RepID=A0A6P8XLP1_DROAB|nr:mitochondrial nicotinamide adenine dinucleotide transporter SLC25A51 [Drosophila albomicans]
MKAADVAVLSSSSSSSTTSSSSSSPTSDETTPADVSAAAAVIISPRSPGNVFLDRFFGAFQWEEFACGCGSAFVNIAVTYPIYKLIFRQMLHGVPMGSALLQLRHEGLGFLYRGMLPPLAQKTISLSIMFGVFDGTRRYLVEDYRLNDHGAKVIAGVVAGSVESILLPFERVQTLLADSKFHRYFSNTQSAFRYVVTNYGFRELYRGIEPVFWRNGLSNALFFMLREEASVRLPKRKSVSSRTAQEFFAGAVIGASISTLFYPLNVIKVSLQSDMGHRTEGSWHACKRIYRERDSRIGNFYRGCAFNTGRSFISWGIMNTAYENLKKLFHQRRLHPPTTQLSSNK